MDLLETDSAEMAYISVQFQPSSCADCWTRPKHGEERRGVWLGVWAVYVKITYQKLKFSFGGKNVNMYFTFIQTIFKTISNMNTSISVIYLY